jgi:hypothetical protein
VQSPKWKNPDLFMGLPMGESASPLDHALLEREFVTDLADSVDRFEREVRGVPIPERREFLNQWVIGHHPFAQQFFRTLHRQDPKRWRAAVERFTAELDRRGIQIQESKMRLAGQPLRLQPDYGESDAALPRGEEATGDGKEKAARRVASLYLARFRSGAGSRIEDMTNPLDGLARPKALRIVQHTIASVDTRGAFRDDHWAPVQAIWKALKAQGISFSINKSQYESETGTNLRDTTPVRKVWEVWVPFTNAKARPDNIYIRIVAAGAGPVEDPLEVYDVTAYAT